MSQTVSSIPSSTSSSLPPPPLRLGVVCTLEQWNASNWSDSLQGKHGSASEPPTTHCLTRGQSIGLTLATEAALVSLVAVLLVFLLIMRNWIQRKRDVSVRRSLFREPADIYMFSLLVADLIQAVGTIMDIRWIHRGIVEAGGFCTAQGIVQQLGEMPVAANTLAIAIHTFFSVWWRKGIHSRRVAMGVVAAIWIYAIVFIIIGATRSERYETPTPYWCWIGPHWLALRIVGEYMWLWLALIFSLVLYLLLALWNRGNVNISQDTWWKFSFRRLKSKSADEEDADLKQSRLAYDLLAYPFTYAILVLPLTIVRWISFSSNIDVPSVATLIIITIYGFSGAANVLLLLLTRPQLLLFNESPRGRRHGLAPSGRTEPPLPDESLSRSSRESSPAPAQRRRKSEMGALPADSPEPSPTPPPRELQPALARGAWEDPYERGRQQGGYDLRVISPSGRPSLEIRAGTPYYAQHEQQAGLSPYSASSSHGRSPSGSASGS